jgi:hypothetical protein
VEVRTGSIYFPPLRGSGPGTATSDVHFARHVEQSVCGLTGYLRCLERFCAHRAEARDLADRLSSE